MKHLPTLAVTLLATLALGCSDSEPTDPNDTQAINGVELTGEIVVIPGGISAFASGMVLSAKVEARNVTSQNVDITYPVSCPVRIRLYRPADDRLIYDQTQFDCDASLVTTLHLGAGQTHSFTTGNTTPTAIEADSVAAGYYRAVGVFRTTGNNPIEVELGQFRLAHCPNPATPQTCAFVGPGATKAKDVTEQ